VKTLNHYTLVANAKTNTPFPLNQLQEGHMWENFQEQPKKG